jgi:hypothetical protein
MPRLGAERSLGVERDAQSHSGGEKSDPSQIHGDSYGRTIGIGWCNG